MRRRLVVGLLAAPAVLAAVGVSAVEVQRARQPRLPLFSRPFVYSLPEAIERHELEQAYAFVRAGQDPNAPIPVRHPILTGGDVAEVSPLVWAAIMQDREILLMLLSFGANEASIREAFCMAGAVGRPDLQQLLASLAIVAPARCSKMGPAGGGLRSFLMPGGVLHSPQGRYRLHYQHDGNLVLYDERTGMPRWSTGTVGTMPGVVFLDEKGHLVVQDAEGHRQWTSPAAGATLTVTDDGDVLIG